MKLNEYQSRAAETAIYPGKGDAIGMVYVTLGLSSEAGELCGSLKKAIRDEGLISPFKDRYCFDDYMAGDLEKDRSEHLLKEAGDVLWYLANLATELGVTLEEIAQANLDKLASRKERGVLGGSGDNR